MRHEAGLVREAEDYQHNATPGGISIYKIYMRCIPGLAISQPSILMASDPQGLRIFVTVSKIAVRRNCRQCILLYSFFSAVAAHC